MTPRKPSGRMPKAVAFCALALALPGLAAGEDIDLYTGAPVAGGKPNVLILMDDASAWSADVTIPAGSNCPSFLPTSKTKDADFMRCALYNAVTGIGNNPLLKGQINMGLMMYNQFSGGDFYFPGKTPAPGPLTLMDDSGISAFQGVVRDGITTQSGTNTNKADEIMQEAWAYYASQTGLSKAKYTSNLQNCQKSFVIFIANAVNNNGPKVANGDTDAYTALKSAGATSAQLAQITIPPPYNNSQKGNAYQQNWADEWARFMYQTDLSGQSSTNPQNIITYTITVTDNSNPDYDQFVKSMANNGGGKNFVVNINSTTALNDLVNDITQIFNEVQAVNSVFASVSLPISVNTQGTYLNQVYIGMFRPDGSGKPRWFGNLKQYQLGFDGDNNVQLEDAKGNAAINSSGTGFVSPNAISFWTADTSAANDGPFTFSGNSIVTNWPTNGFWVNAPAGVGQAFDAPDGEVVEKGGVGEMLRADNLSDQKNRTVYTCTTTSSCSTTYPMASFVATNTALTSGTALGSTTTTPTASDLINWVRGADIANNEVESGPGAPVTVRPSIHGDVLHSRPTVINYAGSTGVVVFYGSNDGMFHAINGNQTAGIGSVRPGGELWSFVAPEFFDRLQRLYSNSPGVLLYGMTDPTLRRKDYFFDGTTSVYQDLRDPKNPKVYIYLTARRGGRFIYAFDVTDPLRPAFLWKKSSTHIAELGQTWSQPKVTLVKGRTNPVIVMGGGYDPAEDSDPAPTSDTQGRAIIVLDAIDGSLVWAAAPNCTGLSPCSTASGMTRAIPADITLLDRNADGNTDRLYAADLGGNIWRVDLEATTAATPDTWAVTKLAGLAGTGNNARKFFYPPDVVPTRNFDAVMAASGDREHPLYSASTTAGTAYNVVNRMYMIQDPNTGNTVPTTWTPITESDLVDETGAASGTTTPYSTTLGNKGFYVTLGHNGEKAVNAPLTVAGYTYFGTNTPANPKVDTTMCYPNLGIARGYAINFLNGTGLNADGYVTFSGGGLPPSPVFGLVSIDQGSGSVITPVLIGGGNQTNATGGNNTSSLGAQKVSPPTLGKRKRTYWYIDGVK